MNQASPIPTTRSPEDAARASLTHARDYMENVEGALRRVVNLFRDARVDEATELYAQSLDALNVLVFVLSAAAPQLDADAIVLPSVDRDCADWIESLATAQDNADWTALADCLQYEVAPGVGRWREQVERLLEAPA